MAASNLELTIERMGHGGVGIGTADDGRVVFVGSTYPGDRVPKKRNLSSPVKLRQSSNPAIIALRHAALRQLLERDAVIFPRLTTRRKQNSSDRFF